MRSWTCSSPPRGVRVHGHSAAVHVGRDDHNGLAHGLWDGDLSSHIPAREIGIRKAIGAERKSIIAQFLIEACMICGIGGLFGIAAGYIGTLIVGKLSFKMILWPSPSVAVGSFFISVALGVIFGLYPAIKASGLQPVDALRAD